MPDDFINSLEKVNLVNGICVCVISWLSKSCEVHNVGSMALLSECCRRLILPSFFVKNHPAD